MSPKTLIIYTDGAASGNPGPAAIGVVIKDGQTNIAEISESIGSATNNVAEYSAVIAALKEVQKFSPDRIIIHTDSELMFHQLTGTYKIKNEHLAVLYQQIRELSRGIKHLEIKHIPREQNQEADKLAKKGVKKQQAKVVASALFRAGEESPSSDG